MSVLARYKGIVGSGMIIEITKVPEGEEVLAVGERVWVAGVDDAGRVNVIRDLGNGDWMSFNPKGVEWRRLFN